MDVNCLSDAELMKRLREHGVDMGPVTDSTREVYRSKLLKIMHDGSRDRSSGPPSKRRKVEPSAPTLPSRVSNKHRGRPRSPRYRSGSPRHYPSLAAQPSRVHNREDESQYRLIQQVDHPRVPRPTPKLAAEPTLTLDEHMSSMAEDLPDYKEDISFSSHPGSNSRVLSDNTMQFEEEEIMVDSSPVLRRKQLHHRSSSGSGHWLGSTVSTTARWIGQGVKSFVNNLLSPGGSGGSQSRNPPSPFRSFRYQDSVEIGGEIEIGDDTSDGGMGQSPEPSAPPFPYQDNTTHYDWELLPSDVQICLRPNGSKWLLGKGGFGEVFKGLKDGVDEVAVKVIRIQQQAATIEQFKHEIDLISKLRHRNILQFYGACIKPTCLYMVTELMQGDLFTFLREDRRYMWSGVFGREVCVGIVTGIHYLHSRRPPIVHRDIKSPNILLMDGLAKIADVGIARAKMNSDMTAQRGYTIAWAAPEVIYRRRATEKIDIWSFGVILWEIVTGQPPHPGKLRIPESASQELRALYSNCTREDPDERPIAGDILVTLKDMQ